MDLDHFWDELDAELHLDDNSSIQEQADQIAEMAGQLKKTVQDEGAQPQQPPSDAPDTDAELPPAQSAGNDTQPESADSNAVAPAASSDDVAPTESGDDDDETASNSDAAPTESGGDDETASDSDAAPAESGDDALPYRKMTDETRERVGTRKAAQKEAEKQRWSVQQAEQEPDENLQQMHHHYSIMHQSNIRYLQTKKEDDKLRAKELKHTAMQYQFQHKYMAAPESSDEAQRAKLMRDHHIHMANVHNFKQAMIKHDELAKKHKENAEMHRQKALQHESGTQEHTTRTKLAESEEQKHQEAKQRKKTAKHKLQEHQHQADAAFYKEQALRHPKGSHKHQMYHHMAKAEEHKHQALLHPEEKKRHYFKARMDTNKAKLHFHAHKAATHTAKLHHYTHKAQRYKRKAKARARKPTHTSLNRSAHTHHLRLSDIIAQRLKL